MERAALSEFVERVRMLHTREERDAAASAVLGAFEGAGVEALLLKGPALARLLYTDGEPRGYWDVDLLVAPQGLSAARRVLADMGYVDLSARVAFGVDDVAGVQHAEIWSRRGEWGPLQIDLHWRLPGWEAPADVAWDALAGRRTSIELAGRKVAVFAREALALHMATHAAQHGPDDLKALGDLGRGIVRWSGDIWRAAARLAAEVEATEAFAAGLRLLPAGARLAQALELPPTEQLTWTIMHRDARPRGTFHLQALKEAKGARERVNVLRRSLLPTPHWMTRERPWAAKGRPWLLAAYVTHILSSPVWAARAWRFRRAARGVSPERP